MLDELDQQMQRRGHRRVRYADDSNVYVRSARAGQRVMASLTARVTAPQMPIQGRKGDTIVMSPDLQS